MQAAIFHGPKQELTIEGVDIDKPGPREVLVKTAASGVCHSDLHFVDGLYPFTAPAVLGHEAAGIVEEVGELVTQVAPGDHVIACLSAFCGNCEYCLTGHPSLCRSPEVRRTPDQPPKLTKEGTDEPIAQFANLFDDAGRLVAQHGGRRIWVEPVDEVEVAVAYAASDRPHEHLARGRLVDVYAFDREVLLWSVEDCCLHSELLSGKRSIQAIDAVRVNSLTAPTMAGDRESTTTIAFTCYRQT